MRSTTTGSKMNGSKMKNAGLNFAPAALCAFVLALGSGCESRIDFVINGDIPSSISIDGIRAVLTDGQLVEERALPVDANATEIDASFGVTRPPQSSGGGSILVEALANDVVIAFVEEAYAYPDVGTVPVELTLIFQPEVEPDADAGVVDAGEPEDGGFDAGAEDAGDSDAGFDAGADAGILDGGPDAGDGGIVDAGALDAGVLDAGVLDAGVLDAGFDAGVLDAGVLDAGFDAGVLDAGFDAGILDAGVLDAGFDAGDFDAGYDAGAPPEAVITLVSVGGVPSDAGTPLVFPPFSEIVLSGAESIPGDAAATVTDFAWQLTQAPSTSSVTLVDTASQTSAQGAYAPGFDIIGDYEVALTVTDDSAQVSAQTLAAISVPPPTGFYVELTWDSPDNLDLHAYTLQLCDAFDCRPTTCTATRTMATSVWDGEFGITDTDPRIFFDNTNGAGAEALHLPVFPADPTESTVHIGVSTTSGAAVAGASTAEVRIFIDGNLEGTFNHTFAVGGYELWTVGDFQVDTKVFTVVDVATPEGLALGFCYD